MAQQSGLPAPESVTRLTGGKNNQVFRIGDSAVLKLYHWDPRDPRDRLRAEWRFLTYAWDRGARNIPRPLARDDTTHAGLYSLVPGRRLAAGDILASHIDAALEFMLAVNTGPRDPAALDPGSEACFTLNEHIATIHRRVAQLATIDPALPHGDAAEVLIRTRLRPLWKRVAAEVLDGARVSGVAPDRRLDDASLCASPSDFGFHNALANGSQIAFIDFEYAGWDDPVKLICDFFCQPEVPVPVAYRADFTRRLIGGLGLSAPHGARCDLLLDAYRIKWTCIILNDFLPLGAARRAYADLAQTEDRFASQLVRAATMLDRINLR
jgi:hypothetical protein